MLRRTATLLAVVGLAQATLVACGNPWRKDTEADRLTPPAVGACRNLDASDREDPSNASPVVACSEDHTAQTFTTGTLPKDTGTAYDDKRHGRYVYGVCSKAFREFLGIDESLAMRVQLSWAWFRPSERAWDEGARWFRCDVLGGPERATELRNLPANARGMFAKELPDQWMTCARGPQVSGSKKLPCSEPHDWRAVATVKLGQPDDEYPGDRVVQVRSRDRCRDWVGAWLHYPPDYDFGYTWFHEAEWSTGNRRAVCWARTEQ